MRILNFRNNSSVENKNYINLQSPTFTATPEEILKAVEKFKINEAIKIAKEEGTCAEKLNFIVKTVDFFNNLKSHLGKNNFVYQLGKENKIPLNLDLDVNGKTLSAVDQELNDVNQRFKCIHGNCSCGEGKTKGQFLNDLLSFLEVNHPNVIDLSKS